MTEACEQLSAPQAARPLFGEDALSEALAGTHGLGAAATVSRLSQILALHTRDWASDDTACSRSASRPLLNPAAASPARDGGLTASGAGS